MKLPPLKSLLYFKHAAELGSFKLAAERLFVTQAAISQQIRLLEQHLGCELFERQTRQTLLSGHGQRLLPHVLAAFAQLESGVQAVQQDPSPHALTLSVLPSFATCWLLPRLHDFQQQYPEIKLRIEPSDQLACFADQQVDAAIRFGHGNYPNVYSEFLADDSLLLAAKPSVIDRNMPIREQLLQLKLISDLCPHIDEAWSVLFQRHGIAENNLPKLLEIDNAALVVQATMAGQGLAILRRRLIEPLLASGQLITLADFEMPSAHQYYFVCPTSHVHRHKIQVFLAWMKQQFRING